MGVQGTCSSQGDRRKWGRPSSLHLWGFEKSDGGGDGGGDGDGSDGGGDDDDGDGDDGSDGGGGGGGGGMPSPMLSCAPFSAYLAKTYSISFAKSTKTKANFMKFDSNISSHHRNYTKH